MANILRFDRIEYWKALFAHSVHANLSPNLHIHVHALNIHSVCANLDLHARSVCANLGLNIHSVRANLGLNIHSVSTNLGLNIHSVFGLKRMYCIVQIWAQKHIVYGIKRTKSILLCSHGKYWERTCT